MADYLILVAVVGSLLWLNRLVARENSKKVVLANAKVDSRKQLSYVSSKISIFDLIIIVLLVLFMGLRQDVGTDFTVYWYNADLQLNQSDSFSSFYNWSNQEIGYVALSYVVLELTHSVRVLFIAVAAIAVVPTYIVLRRASVRPDMSIFLYVTVGSYLAAFNISRQAMAMSLLFFAWYLAKSSKKKALGMALLAVSFHYSAAAIAVFWVLSRKFRPSTRTFGLLAAGALIVALIIPRLPFLMDMVSLVFPRYSLYLAVYTAGIGTLLIATFRTVLSYVALKLLPREYQHMVTMLMLSAVTLYLGLSFKFLARLADYFWMFGPLLIPVILLHVKNSRAWTVVAVAGGILYMVGYLSFYGGLLPYKAVPLFQ